jgi:hypothetical protein
LTERPLAGRPDTPAAALAVTVAVLLLGAGVLAAYTLAFRPAPFAIDPAETRFWGPHEVSTHLSLIKPFFDARGQTLAHLAIVAATALVVLLGRRLGATTALRPVEGVASLVVVVAALAAPLYAPGPKLVSFAAGVALFAVLPIAGRLPPRSAPNRLLGVAIVLALVLATLPGFLRPPDFSRYSWYEMTYGQSHWSLVVGPGDRLAEGQRLGVEVRPQYGLVLPVLWAAGERLVRPFTFGESVRLLLALHVVYLAVAAVLLWRFARGRWIFAGLALALVVPWFHFAHKSLLFPNQGAWRTLAFPLVFGLLWRERGSRPPSEALRVGVLAGGALLFSLESGLAVCVGLLAFLYFRHGAGRRRLVLPFLAGLALALVGFVLVASVVLGQLVSLPRLLLSKAAFLSSGGFSGFRWTPDPWPVLMLGHAVFVLARAATSAHRPARTCYRAAVAATLLVWFAYYANRPDPWNLSSYYVLYGILLVDLARLAVASVLRRRLTLRSLVAVGLLLGVALPNLAAIAGKGADQVGDFLGPALRREAPRGAGLVSDVFVHARVASETEARGGFLRARRGEDPVYLTADSYLVPKVSGRFPALPVADLCWESMTRADYERALDAVVRAPSRRVYLDAPGSSAYGTACGLFYGQVRGDLERAFARDGTESGWEIWVRKP